MGKATVKGEITAFLSLLFILMISLAGALVESASIQVLKSLKRADMNLAIESVFAEYHKDLLDKYELFGVDAGYGEGKMNEDMLLERLAYYGASGIDNEVNREELLSDSSGKAFYIQTIRYMKNKLGMNFMEGSTEKILEWQEQNEKAEEYSREDLQNQEELSSMLEETGESLPQEENPIQSITNIKKSNLLNIIVSNPEEISNRSIETSRLPSGRQLNKGKGTFSHIQEVNEVVGKLFFQEYLMEHFTTALNSDSRNALEYEIEYLLGGKESDAQNLEIVVKKILAVRFALNYAYLLTDEVRMMEAETMALGLCSLLTVPAITKVVKHALLLAWAYGESIVDMRILIAGKKVPVVKNTENWNLQLSQLIHVQEDQASYDRDEAGEGITYQDYLKGFLILEKKERLCIRALDLIEINLGIKSDCCITQLEVVSTCNLPKGIQYKFLTYFGYQ